MNDIAHRRAEHEVVVVLWLWPVHKLSILRTKKPFMELVKGPKQSSCDVEAAFVLDFRLHYYVASPSLSTARSRRSDTTYHGSLLDIRLDGPTLCNIITTVLMLGILTNLVDCHKGRKAILFRI